LSIHIVYYENSSWEKIHKIVFHKFSQNQNKISRSLKLQKSVHF